MKPPPRLRIEKGPYLVCHFLLVAVAILWMPLGCRDPFGTSCILPSLRPLTHTSPSEVVAAATSGTHRRASVAVVVLAPFALAAALVAARSEAPRSGTDRPAPQHRLFHVGGAGVRAPPLAA